MLMDGRALGGKKPKPTYLNLSAQAWFRLRRSWNIPTTASLLRQAYLLGPVRSVLAGLQSLIVGRPFRPVSQAEAVFVLGFWRAGTTFLHELLCLDDRFAYPTTYACFHPHHFVFTEKFVSACQVGEVRRPQDQMTTGWRTPQEDEFALLCLGARSPYEGLIAAGEFGNSIRLADPSDLPEPAR